MTHISNSTVTVNATDRDALVALAEAAKANAEAIKAIAEIGRHHGPVYGIYIAREGE